MNPNMSNFDRAVRAGVAVAAFVVALVIGAGSVGGIVLFVLAGLMAVTATVGFCPLYKLLHLDTRNPRPLPH